MLNRRQFVGAGLGAAAAAATRIVAPFNVAGAVAHRSLDPVNPDILFGITSSLWSQQHEIEWAIKRIAALGLQGIEPYAQQIEKYRSDPRPLKRLFDEAGITLIDVSNGAKGQSTNFIDPDQVAKTIADHVAFARDFLQPFGVHVWKCNMGSRPPGGPTDDQLKTLANTLNEIGRQTIAMGIRMAPHPHIWGPMERVFPSDRRSAPQGHLRQISRQHLHAHRGATPRGERLPQSGRRRCRLSGRLQIAP
jgi:hypothetical protein